MARAAACGKESYRYTTNRPHAIAPYSLMYKQNKLRLKLSILASNSAGARRRQDESSMRISKMANVTNLTKAATPKRVEDERIERVMKRRKRHSYESKMAKWPIDSNETRVAADVVASSAASWRTVKTRLTREVRRRRRESLEDLSIKWA
jgi:hypothetical protein